MANDVTDNMSNTEVVDGKAVSREERIEALSWVWSARFIVVAVLILNGLSSLVGVVLSPNKPGWGYDVFDVAFAATNFYLAYYANKNLKRAYTTLK